jgi:copper chaperone
VWIARRAAHTLADETAPHHSEKLAARDATATVRVRWSAPTIVDMDQTYEVPGISCDHCKRAIEGEVAGVAGVETVEVDVDRRTVHVVGHVDDAAVRAAIDEAGYEVATP